MTVTKGISFSSEASSREDGPARLPLYSGGGIAANCVSRKWKRDLPILRPDPPRRAQRPCEVPTPRRQRTVCADIDGEGREHGLARESSRTRSGSPASSSACSASLRATSVRTRKRNWMILSRRYRSRSSTSEVGRSTSDGRDARSGARSVTSQLLRAWLPVPADDCRDGREARKVAMIPDGDGR